MSDLASVEQELMREGLTSYWDARFAISVFERKIQSITREILSVHLHELSQAWGLDKKISEGQIADLREQECKLDTVTVGSYCPGWEWGVVLGIGWREAQGSVKAMGCLSVRTGAQWKSEKVWEALKKESEKAARNGIAVARVPETTLWLGLEPDTSMADLRTHIDSILSAFAEWGKSAGGLQTVVFPPNVDTTS